MPDPKPAKSQVEKFREMARKIGASESEEPLNEALRRVAAKRVVKAEKAKRRKEDGAKS